MKSKNTFGVKWLFLFITVLSLTILSNNVICQNFFIKPYLSVDNGIKTDDMSYSTFDYDMYIDSTVGTQKLASYKQSFGKGLSYGLAIEKPLTSSLFFELGLSYFKGKPSEYSIESFTTYVPNPAYHIDITYTDIYDYRPIILDVAIGYRKEFGKFALYGSSGINLSYGKLKLTQKTDVFNLIPGYLPFEHHTYIYEYNKRVQFGSRTSIGINYILSDRFSFFIEGRFLFKNISPTKSSLISYDMNGNDWTDSLTVSQKQIEFVDSYDETQNSNSNVPSKQLRRSYSLSSYSILVGIRFKFPAVEKDVAYLNVN